MKNKIERILFVAIVATLAIGCFSCKKKKASEPVITYPQHDRPTWVVEDTTNLEYSMTITGTLNDSLVSEADTTDLVAAFWEDQCCGVASIQKFNNVPLFFLYIVKPSQSPQQFPVTLRYYNAATRYIYVYKVAFTYSPDERLGTVEDPFVADFFTHE